MINYEQVIPKLAQRIAQLEVDKAILITEIERLKEEYNHGTSETESESDLEADSSDSTAVQSS